MVTEDIPETSYPSGRGFVLQFKPASENGKPIFSGRIEHIVSGKVEHFLSAEELNSVLVAMLVEAEKENRN